MADARKALAALNRREEKRADELGAEYAKQAARALSATMVDAATAAVEVALRDGGAGVIAERINDALYVRRAIERQLTEDLLIEEARLSNAMADALAQGYEMDLVGRAEAINQSGADVEMDAEATPQDLETVRGWPINGRSREEWARRLVEQLRWNVEGAIIAPVNGSGEKLSALPRALSDVQATHARAVASIVSDAFFAGTQAATLEHIAHAMGRS